MAYEERTGASAAAAPMKQSRIMSLVEAIANVVAGYGVAVLTQLIVFPWFGLPAHLVDALAIGAIFTGLCGAPHNTGESMRRPSRSTDRRRGTGGDPARRRGGSRHHTNGVIR